MFNLWTLCAVLSKNYITAEPKMTLASCLFPRGFTPLSSSCVNSMIPTSWPKMLMGLKNVNREKLLTLVKERDSK